MKSNIGQQKIITFLSKHLNILACPNCKGKLSINKTKQFHLKCSQCSQNFKFSAGIPLMFCQNNWNDNKIDVTKKINSFYEKNPFPNYEEIDSVYSLRIKAAKGIFAKLLDEQIPYHAKVLEVGCGTGQLGNFLASTKQRAVFSTDMCLNSLKLGNKFKIENNIKNINFFQMNLFKPIFKPESFDIVICNGVLHHTSDPFLGFQTISKLVKKGGFIIIGLYNSYGRIWTYIRKFIFNISGNRLKFLDPRLRTIDVGKLRKYIWFMDQYKNPHESTHTMDEILKWFEKTKIGFIKSIPKSNPFEPFSNNENLFEKESHGTKLDRFLVQTGLFLKEAKEGSFFIMIGQRQNS